jgi:hypothetical protein
MNDYLLAEHGDHSAQGMKTALHQVIGIRVGQISQADEVKTMALAR